MILSHRSKQSFQAMPSNMKTEAKSESEEGFPGWIRLQTGDKNLKVNCLDVLLQ